MTKTILITGTSSGYGKATAELFLERGWNVVAAMRRPDPALFAPSDRLKLVQLDVTDPASINRALSDAVIAFGAIDVLVNNAGIGMASAFEVTPDAALRELFETNTFGTFAMCRAIIPILRKQNGGTIVNVTSSVTLGVMPLVAGYAANARSRVSRSRSPTSWSRSASTPGWSSPATARPPPSPPMAARAWRG